MGKIELITTIDWEPQAAQMDLIDKVNELAQAINEMSMPLKVDRLGKYVVYFPTGGTNIQHYFDTYEAAEGYAKGIRNGSVSVAYVLYEDAIIKQSQRISDIAARLKVIEGENTDNKKVKK